MARTSSEPWKCVLDMGSSSHWGYIITPGQEANGDNLGIVFDLLDNNSMMSVFILMRTQNIKLQDKIRKFP